MQHPVDGIVTPSGSLGAGSGTELPTHTALLLSLLIYGAIHGLDSVNGEAGRDETGSAVEG